MPKIQCFCPGFAVEVRFVFGFGNSSSTIARLMYRKIKISCSACAAHLAKLVVQVWNFANPSRV